MGRKEINKSQTDIEKYRKQLGKQEFKGRNKRNVLSIKAKAEARRQESPLKTGIVTLGILVGLLTAVYFFFYFGLAK
nr:triple QxxK/R motif-containing protein [Hydra vulgaris]